MKTSHKLALGLALCLSYPVLPADAAVSSDRAQPAPAAQQRVIPAASPLQLAQRRRRRGVSWRAGVRSSRYRVGAFSRSGSCPDQSKVTAFVPPPQTGERDDKNNGTVDHTVSSHPTFWVYLANLPPQAQVQFTLQNASASEELLNTRFVLNGQTGLLGVRLPKTAPGLKVGESYLWQVTVQCNSEATLYIGSWVQRITPDQVKPTPTFDPKPLVQALAGASEADKPAIYAALGIWQDAVTTLIDLQKKQPDNRELKEDWRSLLTGAQMSDLLNVPVLGVK